MQTAKVVALEPRRPALRWHGGKWRLAPWVISHFPEHRYYTECYGGGASVLMRKPRSYAEVYNDLDDAAVNFFRVLRDPDTAAQLREALRLTPFARAEFDAAYEPTDEPVEAARRLVIRSFMGFGSDGHNAAKRTGFRAASNRSGTTPARDWVNYPGALDVMTERLRGVVLENRRALDVLRQHDGDETLHYVDPPYLPETRSTKSKQGMRYHAYAHEMDDADHAEMLDVLKELRGMVVLSGYPSDIYDAALDGWWRTERAALADGARKRTEVLWINPAGCRRADDLFGGLT